MIIPPSIQRKHDLVRPYLEDVAGRVRDIVSGYCESVGFAYLGRLKDSQSLSEKIETGRYKSWSDLDDLFACSVIIPTLSDEARVLQYLRASFAEVVCRARGTTRKDPAVFRFDATRFIGKLLPASVPGASQALLNVQFEVQIRSAFEHAWAVTTHALAYKSADVDWRHLRLAAQLKAAVEQLDQVVQGFEETATYIADQEWPEVRARARIRDYFQQKVNKGALPSEAIPSSWGRFCENLYRLMISSTDRQVRDHVNFVEAGLSRIEVELTVASGNQFPRSISLLQFCLGALAKQGFLTKPLHRFTPLLTGELRDLYPDSMGLGAGFDFEFE